MSEEVEFLGKVGQLMDERDEYKRKYEYLLGLCTRQVSEEYLPVMDERDRSRSEFAKSVRLKIDKTAGLGCRFQEEMREYGKG